METLSILALLANRSVLSLKQVVLSVVFHYDYYTVSVFHRWVKPELL